MATFDIEPKLARSVSMAKKILLPRFELTELTDEADPVAPRIAGYGATYYIGRSSFRMRVRAREQVQKRLTESNT